MNAYTANNNERATAQRIRKQYIDREADTLNRLQKLDTKVKTPGRVLSIILGVLGTLVMGSGMSMVMVWSEMSMGLPLGIGGMVVALMAFPLYTLITNSRKKKYAGEIFQLSDQLMTGEGES